MHFSSNNDHHFANKSSVEGSYTVPKTVHFIWTGKPIPQKYIKNIQTFAMNKDYEVFRMNQFNFADVTCLKIILWTDENTLNSLQTPDGFKVKDINRYVLFFML